MKQSSKPRYFGILDIKKGFLHKCCLGFLCGVKCRVALSKMFGYTEEEIKVVEVTQDCYEKFYSREPGTFYYPLIELEIIK